MSNILGHLRKRLNIHFAVSLLVVLGLWHLLGSNYPASTFPDLFELWNAIFETYTRQGRFDPVEHIGVTFLRILMVFVIAMPLGVALGIAMGRNEFFETYFSPYVLIALAFPSIVWAFVAVLWFGLTTYLVPVFVGVVITVPYVIINIWNGTKDLDPKLVEMSDTFSTSPVLFWRYVLIPHLNPYILAMARIVLAIGWKVMLIAEIFGAQSGLGFVIDQFFQLRENHMILAWTLPAMLAIFIFDRALKWMEQNQGEWRADLEINAEKEMAGA